MSKILLPAPMPHQIPILSDPSRFKILVCGRRWGKTTLGLIAAVAGHGNDVRRFKGAIDGGTIWWIAPSYGIASLIWREAKDALADAWVEKSEVRRALYLPGGGQLVVKSADHPDSLRGAGLDGAILDEAAFMNSTTWQEAVRPALADKQGWAMMLTTPCGRNWLFELFEKGKVLDDWATWQQPTSINPIIAPEELENARLQGEYQFRQEFLAEFVAPGGNIFKRKNFHYFTWDDPGKFTIHDVGKDRTYELSECLRMITVDLAASTKTWADYTAMIAVAITPKQDLVVIDVVRDRIDPGDQVRVLRDLAMRWEVHTIGVESGQYQLAFIDDARRSGLPVSKLNPDKDKYARALTLLAMAENGQVFFQADAPWLIALEDELLSFTGDAKYRLHDDQVDALAYAANEAFRRSMDWAGAYGVTKCSNCGVSYILRPANRPCPKCNHRPPVVRDDATAVAEV